jgi:anaerobic selenocysteine-containing dehydrogenase
MLIDPADTVILLPAKTRYEQDDGGTETSTERRIMFSPEIPRPMGEARAEWKILMELAAATYPERAHCLGPADGWKMREEIARVVPFYDGVQHLRKTGDAIQYGGPRLCDDGAFPTPDGKAHFKAIKLPSQLAPASTPRVSRTTPALESAPNASHTSSDPRPASVDSSVASRRFFVSTRRGKQFNTLIYAEIDPLNGAPRDAVLMNALDAESLRLKNGEPIILANDVGRYSGRVFICPIAPGNLQVHWPEGNVILPSHVCDPVGGVPDYNAWAQIERPPAG